MQKTTTPPTELQLALLKRLATGEVVLHRYKEGTRYHLASGPAATKTEDWYLDRVRRNVAQGLEDRGLIEMTEIDARFPLGWCMCYRVTAEGQAVLRWQGEMRHCIMCDALLTGSEQRGEVCNACLDTFSKAEIDAAKEQAHT